MSADERRLLRDPWPVRIYRLGQEPLDDLAASSTPAERLCMVDVLSRRSWELSGRPLPQHSRASLSITVLRRP